MDVEVFPLIAPSDYAAFRNILGDGMPATYHEWFQLQTKEIREFIQAGRDTRKVQVYSDEFVRFLRARGANAPLVSLRNFTIKKDAGSTF
jgi:hypothetical protein